MFSYGFIIFNFFLLKNSKADLCIVMRVQNSSESHLHGLFFAGSLLKVALDLSKLLSHGMLLFCRDLNFHSMILPSWP